MKQFTKPSTTRMPSLFRTGTFAGQTFGILTLAGHGVFQTNSAGGTSTTVAAATTQLQTALASTPPAPVEPPYSTWSTATTTASTNKIFPGKGNDTTTTLGTFVLAVNPAFQPFMTGYPGWNAVTKRLTSPLLFDQNTQIGRSAPLTVNSPGDSNGVLVGTANTLVKNSSFTLIPTLFASPSNTYEVKTGIRSLNMVGGSGTAVRAGIVASGSPGIGTTGITQQYECCDDPQTPISCRDLSRRTS